MLLLSPALRMGCPAPSRWALTLARLSLCLCLGVGLLLTLPVRAEPPARPPAPMQLQGTSAQGQAVDLRALRGKVVVVFFWSTHCPVCLDVMPELRRNLAAWRGRDFEVLTVNQDAQMADWLRYERILDQWVPRDPQQRSVWRHAPGHQDSWGRLPSNQPTTVLLDRQGQQVWMRAGRWQGAWWDDIAEQVLP